MELYIADSLELLLDQLQKQLHRSDPLQGPRILIPNRNLRRWMQMAIASRHGVSANLNFQYLEQGISSIFTGVTELRLASPARQHWALLRALQNSSADALESYRKAAHLSYLFRDYEYHRNPLIRAWQRQLSTSPAGNLEPDIFFLEEEFKFSLEENGYYQQQQEFYTGMLKALHASGSFTFTELACRALEEGKFAPEPLYVFGLSRMSRLHLSLLFRLSLHFPVQIYLFDVFGTSLGPGGQKNWESVHPPELVARKEEDTLFVEHSNLTDQEYSFQRDGLELLYLFQKGSDFLKQNGASLNWHRCLEKSDGGILRSKRSSAIRVVEAPNMRQEVESIHDDILLRIKDQSLAPEDFGILVPTMHRYRAHFEYVFNGRNQLPFNLTDFSARETSRLGDAVRTLLKFDQPLDRRTVFHLLSNPMIRKKWGFRGDDYQDLLRKVDDLNVFRSHRDSVFPVHTWEHGLRRLRLSTILVGTGQSFQGYRISEEGYDVEVYGRLHEFVESLKGYRKRLNSNDDPFRAIREMLDAFLSLEDYPGEARIYLSLLENLQKGGESCRELGIAPTAVMAREWALDSLNEVAGGIGEYLIQGVTISALQPMRPIPFRYLYIAGLKEGDFPGFPLNHPEDLRRQYRLPGDSSLPDGNRFLFLEALSSFTDGLTLSYVGRDLARDDEYQPSSVILELEDIVGLQRTRLPLLWISEGYQNQDILDPVHARVLENRWQKPSGMDTADNAEAQLEQSVPAKTSYQPHQLSRLFSEPLRAFLEFRLAAYPLRQEDASDVSDEPFRLLSSHRKRLKYFLRDIAPHYLERIPEYRQLILDRYSELILSGAAPADFFAELDLQQILNSQGFLSLQSPAFRELRNKSGQFVTSLPPAISHLPFMRFHTAYHLDGLNFHYTMPFISPDSGEVAFASAGVPEPRDYQAALLNLLFYCLRFERELNHRVYFLNLSGEGTLERYDLKMDHTALHEMARFIYEEVTIYGPLMFHDSIEEGQELTHERLEELMLEAWQDLQESDHPVLSMVMEKMDARSLGKLVLDARQSEPDQGEQLHRRIQMRKRMEEIWK